MSEALTIGIFSGGPCLPSPTFWTDPLGFHAQITFNHSNILNKLGLFSNSLCLLAVSLYLVSSSRAIKNPPTQFRLFVVGYTLITGVFHSIRAITDANRLLLIGAALHNLFEWGILTCLVVKKDDINAVFKGFCLWIWLVITLCCIIPNWVAAVFVEQQSGILCDYLLVCITLTRCLTTTTNASIFKRLTAAAFIHFGQILPLVLVVFGVDSPIVEWIVIFTAPITFMLYADAALDWDAETARPQTVEETTERRLNTSPKGPYLTDHLWKYSGFKWKLGSSAAISIILGLATISGPVVLFDMCPSIQPQPNAFCVEEVPVVGYTVVRAKPGQEAAMEQWMEDIITVTRSKPGNLFYYMLKGRDGEFVFFEKWANQSILDAHKSSEQVSKIFRTPEFQAMMENFELHGPYHTIEPCRLLSTDMPPIHLAFHYQIHCPIDHFWKSIANMSDVSWIIGAKEAVITGSTKKIIFPTGWMELEVMKVDHKTYTYVQKMLEMSPGFQPLKSYHGKLHLEYDSPQTTNVSYVVDASVADGKDWTTVRKDMIEEFNLRHEVIKARFQFPPINTCTDEICQ